MDTSYDKVISYLTEEKGLSLKEAEEIMVLCVEQGMDPTEIFGRGLIDMLNLLPKKKKVEAPKPTAAPKPVPSTSTGTPAQGNLLTKKGTAQNFTGGRTPFTSTSPVPAPSSPLPKPAAPAPQAPGQLKLKLFPAPKTKSVDRIPTKVQPPAPKPEFGPNAVKSTPYKTSKPELRPGGQTPKPEFKTTQPRPNAGGATVIPRTNANTRVVQPQAPKPNFGQSLQNLGNRAYATAAAKTPTRLPRGSRLKGPLAVAAEIGAEMALEPVAKAGGNALTRTILDITGKGNRARQVAPSLYGKSGPDFTPDIAKGIQQRSKLAQQSAETQAASQPKPQPTGERSAAANAEKQEIAKANAQRRRAAAADFDKTFAAKRAAGEKEFTWRGKRYTTKLKEEQVPIHPAEDAFNKSTPEARAANMKKYGTPYPPIDTSRRSGDRTAPAWMRGGFKSRDEYNKLDQATKDLLN